MENKTKLRLLYLYQYLVQHTDSEHTISTADLIKVLDDVYSIKVSRNTIANDLMMLHESGLSIEHFQSTQNRYYYDGQVYDLAELKVLADAVLSSKFITQRKSEKLIDKLLSLTNDYNAEKLRRNITVQGRTKSENENGYYIADAVHEAIDKKKKIVFRYTDYDINKKRITTNSGEKYTVSPYTLIWDGDYYYMRGYCDEREGMRNFRLDRIEKQPIILEETAVHIPDNYNPVKYSKTVFRMYDTEEPVNVKLKCHASVMKYIVDAFGRDIEVTQKDKEFFEITPLVCTSTTFYRWVFGFSGKIQIVYPIEVREEYKKRLQDALQMI